MRFELHLNLLNNHSISGELMCFELHLNLLNFSAQGYKECLTIDSALTTANVW